MFGKGCFSFLVVGVFALLTSCKYFDPDADFIDEKVVWQKIKQEAPQLGLEPSFVYAICHAESSLNANAKLPLPRE